jgi:hypothetical protein
VIPEPVFTREAYEALLEQIYADLAPHDPADTLRHEWVNARGAIARFDRMALEIRLLDVQECPRADLAIAAAVSRILRSLCDTDPVQQELLRGLETDRLARILARVAAEAECATIDDPAYLRALGLDGTTRSAGALWSALVDLHVAPDAALAEHAPALDVLLGEGCLARRLLRRLGEQPTREALRSTYRELADCLREGRLLRVAG